MGIEFRAPVPTEIFFLEGNAITGFLSELYVSLQFAHSHSAFRSIGVLLPPAYCLLFLRFRLDEPQVAVGAMVDDVDAFAVGVAEDDGARARAVERLDGFLDAHGF